MRTIAAAFLLLAFSLARADDAALAKEIDEARALEKAGKRLDAEQKLEGVIRRAETMPPKYEARDEILKIGPIDPRPIDGGEKALVLSRIRDERIRLYRERAGEAYRRNWYPAELAFQQAVLDTMADPSDEQKRVIADVRLRLLHTVPPADQKLFDQMKGVLKDEALLKEAAKYEKTQKYVAMLLYDKFYFDCYDDAKREPAAKKRKEMEDAICADLTPEQAKFVDDTVHHPSWERLDAIPSHHFIFIGDRDFLARIPGESKLKLDLVYLFLTDLNDYPNPDSQGRITVYFKQLWNFGGGIGGGRTIDIGSVDPKQPNPSVSNGLFYHELSHCLFYSAMIYTGIVEGIANFGATYGFEAAGDHKESMDWLNSNYGQFEKEYLGREMAYWRIQNYGPSCGFLLHFLVKYAKDGDRLDWAKYRRFFRLLEEDKHPRDETWWKVRYFAWCLAQCFGAQVWEDLEKFGFPIRPSFDPDDVAAEKDDLPAYLQEADGDARAGDFEPALRVLAAMIAKHPKSHLIALARLAILHGAEEAGKADLVGRMQRELGILRAWKVCGPFYSVSHTTLQDELPPETEIDFAKEYKSPQATAKWTDPEGKADGSMEFRYAYPDYCATFAVTWLKCAKDAQGFLWIGSDDKHAVWLNGRLVEKQDTDRKYLFDEDRHPIALRGGWNRLLVKVSNIHGETGFGCRVTDTDGNAIEGLEQTAEPHEEAFPAAAAPVPKAVLYTEDFRDKNSFPAHWTSVAGKWRVQNQRLTGLDNKHNVEWQKFVVTPGVEKDSPANFAWLKPPHYSGVKDFRIDLDCAMGQPSLPKFTLTIDGEGENDGLSGWTFVFLPGEGTMAVQLWEYDRFVYHAPAVKVAPAKVLKVSIVRFDGFVTVTLGDQVALDRVPARPLKKDFIGLATFGTEPSISSFTLTSLSARKGTK